MTLGNYEKFVYLAGQYNQQIKFYNVEKICAEKIAEIRQMMSSAEKFERFTIGAVYRLLIADVLPADVEKVIYVDSDIIFNLDAKELFNVDMAGKPLAAVTDFDCGIEHKAMYWAHMLVTSGRLDYTEYLTSAVLVIDLNYWRKNFELIEEGLTFVAKNTNWDYFDQDVLNYCFGKNFLHLPKKYSRWVVFERRKNSPVKRAIYHYVSQSLGLNMRDDFNRLWFKYFEKTPWFNVEAIGHIYEGVQQIQHGDKSLVAWLSKAMAGRQRAFFVPLATLETSKIVFGIDPSEEVIVAMTEESFKQLVASMKKSAGQKLYFILVINFKVIAAMMSKEGFIEAQ